MLGKKKGKLTPKAEGGPPSEVFVDDDLLRLWRECSPADRPGAEAALSDLYALLDFPPPKFRWVASPLEVHKATLAAMPVETRLEGDPIGRATAGSVASVKRHPIGGYIRDAFHKIPSGGSYETEDASLTNEQTGFAALVRAMELSDVSPRSSGFSRTPGSTVGPRALVNGVVLARSEKDRAFVEAMIRFSRAQSGCFWYADSVEAVLSDRPTRLHFDDRMRIHSVTGPAIQYVPNTSEAGLGFSIYAIHGITVPRKLVENRDSITVEEIEREQNQEVRRIMVEAYGAQRYLENSNAEMIHADLSGQLWRKNMPNDEPLVMVRVKNSTPEPDGSIKVYWLRVPPTVLTAQEGVAWTFNMQGHEYVPEQET
jgi:hypothetical protein